MTPPEAGSQEGATPGEVKSGVKDIEWKEIILSRQDFEMLNDRLNKPIIKVEYFQDEFDRNWGFIFPLFFFVFYTIIIFKDELKVTEGALSILKFSLFLLTVYYIGSDKTLRKMGVNFTSQIIIAFCFAALLLAASSVV